MNIVEDEMRPEYRREDLGKGVRGKYAAQQAFIESGLASREAAKQSGQYVSSEDVLRELDRILASAIQKTSKYASQRSTNPLIFSFLTITGITMTALPKCPQCSSEYTYEDGSNYVCPECAHEWAKDAPADAGEQVKVFKDAFGNVLVDGDSVTVIKDLKIKGSSSVVKVGTKVKNIRLVDGDHDIDCKIDGIGAMQLKTEFVKKA